MLSQFASALIISKRGATKNRFNHSHDGPTKAPPPGGGAQEMTVQAGWLLPFLVSLFLMLLAHRSGSNFFGPVPVAPGLLRVLLDMLILPLLFWSNSRHMLFLRH